MKKFDMLPQGHPSVTPRKGPSLCQHMGDFTVILLGSGCSAPVQGRSFSATLLQYKGIYFLVDVGAGTTARLAEAGVPIGKMKHIFFTHHHVDHNAGYPYLAITSWLNGRDELSLYGPPKTRELHEVYVDYYAEDLRYRSARTNRSIDPMTEGNICEMEEGGAFNLDGVQITAAKLTHSVHSLGYRFEVDGQVIVVSGDTSYDPALVALAKDADILVMDSGALPAKAWLLGEASKGGGVPEGMAPPHPQKGEVARMAAEAGVKTLVFTHYDPIIVDEEAAIEALRRDGFTGEVVFGRDLMEIKP